MSLSALRYEHTMDKKTQGGGMYLAVADIDHSHV